MTPEESHKVVAIPAYELQFSLEQLRTALESEKMSDKDGLINQCINWVYSHSPQFVRGEYQEWVGRKWLGAAHQNQDHSELMTVDDLGLMMLLLSPAMLMSVILLWTFAAGG